MFVLLLVSASNGGAQVQPLHTSRFNNWFIAPDEMMPGICSPADGSLKCEIALETEAALYYKAIGIYETANDPMGKPIPTHDRGTFAAWKQTFGFSADPNAPVLDEIRAIYFNNGDLQLGRDMHCRTQASKPLGGLRINLSYTYACYVSNYSDSGVAGPSAKPQDSLDLVSLNHPIATVVMEMTATPHFVHVSNPTGKTVNGFETVMKYSDVRFFAYGKDGSPIVAAALDGDVTKPGLGPESSNKALPGLCIACHGGGYQSSTQGGARVLGANFLPFDTSSFLYSTNPALTEVAQRESFRRLNQFVKSTQPVAPTIVDLIDGWHQWCGGVSQTGCYIDDDSHPFIPGESCATDSKTCKHDCPSASDSSGLDYTCGWGQAAGIAPTGYSTAAFDARAFYKQVVAKECRTCHVARQRDLNVENYNLWVSHKDLIQDDLFIDGRMPFGQVPFVDFWSQRSGANGDRADDFMKGFFGCPATIPPILTGDGSDLVMFQVIPHSVHIDQVGLSLTLSNAITGCPGHCWWKGINLADAEVSMQDSTQTGSILVSDAKVKANPTLILKKAKTFGIHQTVQTMTLPLPPFEYGGCTLSFNWVIDN